MKWFDLVKLFFRLIPLILQVIAIVKRNKHKLNPDYINDLVPLLLDFANTMTEITVNGTTSPLVLDDPKSSLSKSDNIE